MSSRNNNNKGLQVEIEQGNSTAITNGGGDDTPNSLNSLANASTDSTAPRGIANRNMNKSKKKKNKVSASATMASTSAATTTTTYTNSIAATLSLEDQLAYVKDQVQQEKAGKRKLFHSLVKLAHELRKTRDEMEPLQQQRAFAEKAWHEGGIWRSPSLLPGVTMQQAAGAAVGLRQQVLSLTDLFFALCIITAFTRVGVAISTTAFVDMNSLLYFAVFWSVWSKEVSYSTRFDTTDLSAQAVTLLNCLAVLFASLSVRQPINSVDGGRVMIMAAFVAALHLLLHIRVVVTVQRKQGCNNNLKNLDNDDEHDVDYQRGVETDNTRRATATAATSPSQGNNNMLGADDEDSGGPFGSAILLSNVTAYAVYNIVMNFIEMTIWIVGVAVFPEEWTYRWLLFLGAILFSMRVPSLFLPSDFRSACSKRGVLFILLLGFLMQSIIVVASEFFTYQTPTMEDYAFIGAACLMLFCMKLLYVDDADTLAEDHAYMISKTTAFFFNLGNFVLLLSTTVLGSGLNLLTHDYLAATQALPGPSKSMVCGGFAAVLFSTFFVKSMHLKRVPDDGRGQCLFVSAYLMQTTVLLTVVGITMAMAVGHVSGLLAMLMEKDIVLLLALSGAAVIVVVMHWLDEGVELALYGTRASAGRMYRVHAFGIWWCLKPTRAATLSRGEDYRAGGSVANLYVDPSSSSSSSFGNFRGMGEMSSLLGSSASLIRDYKATQALSSPGSGGGMV